MSKAIIATYLVTVRKNNSRQLELLGNIDGQGGEALNFTAGVLDALKDETANEDEQVLVSVQQYERQNPYIAGLFDSGGYGRAGRVVHVDTKASTPTSRREALCVPFYFRFYLPPTGRAGILILQKHGSAGLISALRQSFRPAFAAAFPGHTISFEPLVPGPLLAQLRSGAVKEVTLTGYRRPTDLAALSSKGLEIGNASKVKVVISAANERFLTLPEKMWETFGKRDGQGIFTFPEEFDVLSPKISVKVNYKGRFRTLNFERGSAFSPSFEISDEVEFDKETNHPTFESIDSYCLKLIEEMAEALDVPAPTSAVADGGVQG